MKVYVVVKHEWIQMGDSDSEKESTVLAVTSDRGSAERLTNECDKWHGMYGEVVEKELDKIDVTI